MNLSDKELEFLYARLSELYERAEAGTLSVSPFFSPAELVHVKCKIAQRKQSDRAVIYGGYEGAERARVYFLPEYIPFDGTQNLTMLLCDFGYDISTVMLKIEASGFKVLSHRDFMGSILSLGIERDVIGDIITDGDFCAYVICDAGIAPYIKENLKKVSNDSVKIKEAPLSDISFERRFEPIHETVASCRFDGVIAAVCNISRDMSKKLVCSGMCELNYEIADAPDTELCAGDIFSIRGKGKFKFVSCDGENRRGRLRITVYRYI